ncbi:uncharacterized protein BO97DRAFT_220371 [Aspergillus homomorphus CBS 101889]|uniref:Uncharacterized protein n=1 Tax=Aspergillus homomorphus (strain CBS 101889) TaxID=1450537 RepID=A0A395I602_ASPHC|nr:hypothetical protein BO97DRAFT_220371 [Aspergillus homomorphus CBS 101889]RAL15682.1 hypothetical protein BO97DRAFT_220371 [Aspergillus homomorphus CBS 101889]
MSNDRSTDPISVPPPSAHRRRASLASGLSFTDYLSRSGGQGASTGAPSGSMASSVGNAPSNQGRRLSITTLGLAGSPNQISPWGNKSMRHGSISSSVGSGSANSEDAVAEDSENGPSSATPQSPFARRLSFGAQALRDARVGSVSNGRYPSLMIVSDSQLLPPTCSAGSVHSPPGSNAASTNNISPEIEISNMSWRQIGEGFNWSEALRTRAERAPSFGVASPNTSQTQLTGGSIQQGQHQRATSIASIEQPAREMPKQPKQNKPDFFQEKILRGDFMD